MPYLRSFAIRALITFGLVVSFALPAYATLGVGVGTGKIQVNDKLRPGVIYDLPSISVLNTGDEKATYSMGVAYHEKQAQLAPPKSWFTFTPDRFELEPTQAQLVKITLTLPVKTDPGDYFAYIEARPLRSTENGESQVSIAAASKLTFSVEPANFLAGLYYRLYSFWKINTPWIQWVTGALGAVLLVLILKRFIKVEINVKPKSGHKKSSSPGADNSSD